MRTFKALPVFIPVLRLSWYYVVHILKQVCIKSVIIHTKLGNSQLTQLTFQSVPRLTPSSRQWELSHVFAMLSGSFPRFERLPAGVLRHTCSFTCSCSSGSFLSVKGSVHLNYENHYFLSYFYWCLEHFAQSWQLSCDYFLSACVGCLCFIRHIRFVPNAIKLNVISKDKVNSQSYKSGNR